MSNGIPPSDTDLSADQVKRMLAMQGFSVPDEELIEITVSLNALIEGLVQMERFATPENEPWPTLIPVGGGNAR